MYRIKKNGAHQKKQTQRAPNTRAWSCRNVGNEPTSCQSQAPKGRVIDANEERLAGLTPEERLTGLPAPSLSQALLDSDGLDAALSGLSASDRERVLAKWSQLTDKMRSG